MVLTKEYFNPADFKTLRLICEFNGKIFDLAPYYILTFEHKTKATTDPVNFVFNLN